MKSTDTVECPRCGQAGHLTRREDGTFFDLICSCVSGPTLSVSAEQVDVPTKSSKSEKDKESTR